MAEVTYTFRGMNNVDDPLDVGAPVPDSKRLVFTEGTLIQNADPDNDGGCALRPGFLKRYNGDIASMFYGGGMILFQQGVALKRFWPDTLTSTYIYLGLDANRETCFCDVNGLVVYSDGVIIRRVYQGADHAMPTPTEQFKLPTPPGQCMALFYRRLLVGQDDVVFFTIPDDVTQMDERLNQIPLGGYVKEIIPVDDGWYASTEKVIYFIGGRGPEQWKQPGAVRKVADFPIIPNSVIRMNADRTSMETQGNICQFTTTRGVYYGLNNGTLVPASARKVHPAPGTKGAAVLREMNGQTHYLCVLRDTVGDTFNVASVPTIWSAETELPTFTGAGTYS